MLKLAEAKLKQIYEGLFNTLKKITHNKQLLFICFLKDV